MTTTTHQTEIIVDSEVPLVRIVREFDAPADKVFRAHVDVDLVTQWLGPRGYRMDVEHWDATTGGAYRYAHVDGDDTYRFHGSFHDVRPDETTIVQTFAFDEWPDAISLDRLVVTELPDGRSRLESTSLCDSFEARDAFIASGMETGVSEGYEQLDELLAR